MVLTNRSDEMISEESKIYWSSVSERLINNETVESIRIDSGKEIVCRKIGPFLNFMHNFRFYCFNKWFHVCYSFMLVLTIDMRRFKNLQPYMIRNISIIMFTLHLFFSWYWLDKVFADSFFIFNQILHLWSAFVYRLLWSPRWACSNLWKSIEKELQSPAHFKHYFSPRLNMNIVLFQRWRDIATRNRARLKISYFLRAPMAYQYEFQLSL